MSRVDRVYMSRSKLQQVIHVRVVDNNEVTVEVRLYSQSGETVHCVGTLRVSRAWWRRLLFPVLQSGASTAGVQVVFDIRNREESRDGLGAPSAVPAPLLAGR